MTSLIYSIFLIMIPLFLLILLLLRYKYDDYRTIIPFYKSAIGALLCSSLIGIISTSSVIEWPGVVFEHAFFTFAVFIELTITMLFAISIFMIAYTLHTQHVKNSPRLRKFKFFFIILSPVVTFIFVFLVFVYEALISHSPFSNWVDIVIVVSSNAPTAIALIYLAHCVAKYSSVEERNSALLFSVSCAIYLMTTASVFSDSNEKTSMVIRATQAFSLLIFSTALVWWISNYVEIAKKRLAREHIVFYIKNNLDVIGETALRAMFLDILGPETKCTFSVERTSEGALIKVEGLTRSGLINV